MLPMFVADGLAEPRPISSMPGVVQHTLASVRAEAERAAAGRLLAEMGVNAGEGRVERRHEAAEGDE